MIVYSMGITQHAHGVDNVNPRQPVHATGSIGRAGAASTHCARITSRAPAIWVPCPMYSGYQKSRAGIRETRFIGSRLRPIRHRLNAAITPRRCTLWAKTNDLRPDQSRPGGDENWNLWFRIFSPPHDHADVILRPFSVEKDTFTSPNDASSASKAIEPVAKQSTGKFFVTWPALPAMT
jgi:hypothetical protein